MELAHRWKLFLRAINLQRGCLAPPSAPHTGARALARATPADREGTGDASCGTWALAVGPRDETPGRSSASEGRALPAQLRPESGPLMGRGEMVPCRHPQRAPKPWVGAAQCRSEGLSTPLLPSALCQGLQHPLLIPALTALSLPGPLSLL